MAGDEYVLIETRPTIGGLHIGKVGTREEIRERLEVLADFGLLHHVVTITKGRVGTTSSAEEGWQEDWGLKLMEDGRLVLESGTPAEEGKLFLTTKDADIILTHPDHVGWSLWFYNQPRRGMCLLVEYIPINRPQVQISAFPMREAAEAVSEAECAYGWERSANI